MDLIGDLHCFHLGTEAYPALNAYNATFVGIRKLIRRMNMSPIGIFYPNNKNMPKYTAHNTTYKFELISLD